MFPRRVIRCSSVIRGEWRQKASVIWEGNYPKIEAKLSPLRARPKANAGSVFWCADELNAGGFEGFNECLKISTAGCWNALTVLISNDCPHRDA
jgi:hypothetical protein